MRLLDSSLPGSFYFALPFRRSSSLGAPRDYGGFASAMLSCTIHSRYLHQIDHTLSATDITQPLIFQSPFSLSSYAFTPLAEFASSTYLSYGISGVCVWFSVLSACFQRGLNMLRYDTIWDANDYHLVHVSHRVRK